MDSTDNNNNNQMLFLCELKELRKELSTMKKRIVQLEESHEEQQERLDILERENQALKTQLNPRFLSNLLLRIAKSWPLAGGWLNLNGAKEAGSTLKRKRTDQEQDNNEETESKSTSVSTSASTDKKKAKITNDNEVVPICDNGDSFDSLSDDLLHKIVEFDGNCYSKFGSINKRCRNIYDVKEYKLKKETCVFGYGTLDMMLQQYLQTRKEGMLLRVRYHISAAVIWYNRLDAIDWIIQLEDIPLLQMACWCAANYGKTEILRKVFCKCNVTMLDQLLNDTELCDFAALHGHLETLKWLRKYGAEWNAGTFIAARNNGHDDIVRFTC